ncbi:MAG: NAD(P)-dependent oxidoreductase, partial [Candidatus Atribacteria bacterium]|nr:NAD(P)-dependent oxidoreductase [Candidatus Atribacteria bacterium]
MKLGLPELIDTEITLDDILSHPRPALVEFVRNLRDPVLILGAGGKMGPSLSLLVKRALNTAGRDIDVIAVSLFHDGQNRQWLEAHGVRTIVCDLMSRENLRKLPDCENVVYMAGMKFGTTLNPARTWAFNALLPANVCERFPHARIVALSTGNVYPQVPVESGGSFETDILTPLGEYSNACVARERIFEFFSQQNKTPITLIRLSYALDLRYGVLVDIAQMVYAGQEVDVTMGYFNWIWQRDANEMILRSLGLAASPPIPLNLTGPIQSVREVAKRFAKLMDCLVK